MSLLTEVALLRFRQRRAKIQFLDVQGNEIRSCLIRSGTSISGPMEPSCAGKQVPGRAAVMAHLLAAGHDIQLLTSFETEELNLFYLYCREQGAIDAPLASLY